MLNLLSNLEHCKHYPDAGAIEKKGTFVRVGTPHVFFSSALYITQNLIQLVILISMSWKVSTSLKAIF